LLDLAIPDLPPPGAAARRFDDERIPGLHRHLRRAGQFLDRSIPPFHGVAPDLTRLAAVRALGWNAAMAGE
jgi:hypothetical protein